MALLYDQFNRPIRPTAKPDRRPLAAAPIMDSVREYVAAGLTPQRLASIFIEADAGDVGRQAELFDQLEEKDSHLLGEKTKRQNAILDLDFTLTPASDDKRDVQVAEFCQDVLDNLTDWPDTLTAMQDAVGKGFAGLELDWDVSSGQAVPQGLEFLEQKRFRFTDSAGRLRKTPLLLSDENLMGEEIPAWKILFHRYGGKSGHPTRSGVFRLCAWMFLFKNYSIKDWMVFLEVFGMPLRLGKYDQGASSEDKEALELAISSLGTDAAGIISKSTEIEFVEAIKGKAAGNPFQEMAKFANGEQSKAILGQTLTAEVGDVGSYAASQTHNDVRLDLLKADGRAIAGTVRTQLLRPLVGFNFGWDTAVPLYKSDWEEGEDLAAKAEWVDKLLGRGVTMPLSFVRREFKIPEPEEGEEVVGGLPVEQVQAAKQPAPAVSVDESPADTLDALGANLLAQGDMDSLIEPIKQLLDEVETLGEFRDRLLEFYGDMDETALGELMARAMSVADLAGRFDASGDR